MFWNLVKLGLISISCASFLPFKVFAVHTTIYGHLNSFECGDPPSPKYYTKNDHFVGNDETDIFDFFANFSGGKGSLDLQGWFDDDENTIETIVSMATGALTCDDSELPLLTRSSVQYVEQIHFFMDPNFYAPGSKASVPITLVTENNLGGGYYTNILNVYSHDEGPSFSIVQERIKSSRTSSLDIVIEQLSEPEKGFTEEENNYYTLNFIDRAYQPEQSVGTYRTLLKFGPLPQGVTCVSSGFAGNSSFFGCPQDEVLSVSNVKIAQAVGELNGVNNLVLNRNTTIFAEIRSKIGAGEVPVRACVMDEDGSCDESRILGGTDVNLGTFTDTTIIQIHFGSYSPRYFDEGEYKIIVEIDPLHQISKQSINKQKILDVNFTETKKLELQYVFVSPSNCSENHDVIPKCSYSENRTSATKTIRDGNELLQNIYPVPNIGVVTRKPIFEMEGSYRYGLNFTIFNGVSSDIYDLYYASKKRNPQAKRTIGIVPDGYFEYHGRPNVKGITKKNSKVVLVSLNRPDAIAHELGHTFGLAEGYRKDYLGDIVDGYLTEYEQSEDGFSYPVTKYFTGALDMMGASVPNNFYWISKLRWTYLITKLATKVKDPELLVMGALVNKNGAVTPLHLGILDGFPDEVASGDYTLLLKDQSGAVLDAIPFEADFKHFVEPFGEEELEETLVSFAIPFNASTATVQMLAPDQSLILTFDPTVKALVDALDEISDDCLVGNASDQRDSINSMVSQFESLVMQGQLQSAKNLLLTEIGEFIESSVSEECNELNGSGTSSEDLVNLLNKLNINMAARIDTTPNLPPAIVTGDDVSVELGEVALVDASSTTDPDGGPQALSFEWIFSVLPEASQIDNHDISALEGGKAMFTADVAGEYILRVGASDGVSTSYGEISVLVTPAEEEWRIIENVELVFSSPRRSRRSSDATVFVSITNNTGAALSGNLRILIDKILLGESLEIEGGDELSESYSLNISDLLGVGLEPGGSLINIPIKVINGGLQTFNISGRVEQEL